MEKTKDLSISSVQKYHGQNGPQPETDLYCNTLLVRLVESSDSFSCNDFINFSREMNCSPIEHLTNCTSTPSIGWAELNTPKILEIVLLGILVFMTICGNSLVVVAFLRFRKLRTLTNYYIISLAVADLLLGSFVLPLSTILTTNISSWTLGVTFCNIYVASDVCLCTSSILNLFAISVERYICITKPFQYKRWVSHRKVVLVIIVIWLVSIIVSFIPLHLGWNTLTGEVQNTADPSKCILEYNTSYNLIIAIGTFFIPLCIMWWFYCKILLIARRQAKELGRLAAQSIRLMAQMLQPKSEAAARQGRDDFQQKHSHEKKATITVAAIVCAFTICWVPYFTTFTVRVFLADDAIPGLLDDICLWLGYANSTLNPILYAFINREWRRAFKQVVVLNCKRNEIDGAACRDRDDKFRTPITHSVTAMHPSVLPPPARVQSAQPDNATYSAMTAATSAPESSEPCSNVFSSDEHEETSTLNHVKTTVTTRKPSIFDRFKLKEDETRHFQPQPEHCTNNCKTKRSKSTMSGRHGVNRQVNSPSTSISSNEIRMICQNSIHTDNLVLPSPSKVVTALARSFIVEFHLF